MASNCTLKKNPRRSIRENSTSIEINSHSAYLSVYLYFSSLLGFLQGKSTKCLLDMGAQANFLSYQLASDLKLNSTHRTPGRLSDGTSLDLWDLGDVFFYLKGVKYTKNSMPRKSANSGYLRFSLVG